MALGLFTPQRFKNLQIIKWETSLCFDSIFKFVGFFKQYSYCHRLALIKTLSTYQSQNHPRVFFSGKNHTRTCPILVSPGKRGCGYPRKPYVRHVCLPDKQKVENQWTKFMKSWTKMTENESLLCIWASDLWTSPVHFMSFSLYDVPLLPKALKLFLLPLFLAIIWSYQGVSPSGGEPVNACINVSILEQFRRMQYDFPT